MLLSWNGTREFENVSWARNAVSLFFAMLLANEHQLPPLNHFSFRRLLSMGKRRRKPRLVASRLLPKEVGTCCEVWNIRLVTMATHGKMNRIACTIPWRPGEKGGRILSVRNIVRWGFQNRKRSVLCHPRKRPTLWSSSHNFSALWWGGKDLSLRPKQLCFPPLIVLLPHPNTYNPAPTAIVPRLCDHDRRMFVKLGREATELSFLGKYDCEKREELTVSESCSGSSSTQWRIWLLCTIRRRLEVGENLSQSE